MPPPPRRAVLSFAEAITCPAAPEARSFPASEDAFAEACCTCCSGRRSPGVVLPPGVESLEQWLDLNA
jgi:hypothetical protein